MRVEVCRSWQEWKPLRLEGLADTPIGFGELHADAAAQTDEQWEERWSRSTGLRLLAYDESAPVGMAGGFVKPDGRNVLFGVYVRRAARGQGVLVALVNHVLAWCAPDPLWLDVHEDNHRAQAAYRKLGFIATGERTSGGGIDGRDLLEMRHPAPEVLRPPACPVSPL